MSSELHKSCACVCVCVCVYVCACVCLHMQGEAPRLVLVSSELHKSCNPQHVDSLFQYSPACQGLLTDNTTPPPPYNGRDVSTSLCYARTRNTSDQSSLYADVTRLRDLVIRAHGARDAIGLGVSRSVSYDATLRGTCVCVCVCVYRCTVCPSCTMCGQGACWQREQAANCEESTLHTHTHTHTQTHTHTDGCGTATHCMAVPRYTNHRTIASSFFGVHAVTVPHAHGLLSCVPYRWVASVSPGFIPSTSLSRDSASWLARWVLQWVMSIMSVAVSVSRLLCITQLILPARPCADRVRTVYTTVSELRVDSVCVCVCVCTSERVRVRMCGYRVCMHVCMHVCVCYVSMCVQVDEGAGRVLQVATDPSAPSQCPSGGYWARRQPDAASELSRDMNRAQRMWDLSMEVRYTHADTHNTRDTLLHTHTHTHVFKPVSDISMEVIHTRTQPDLAPSHTNTHVNACAFVA